MGSYKYKAFISYSHKDAAWGRWLHKRLENYRLPSSIIGQKTRHGTVPANLKPIFRDKEELSAGADLGERIQSALDNSENLIILCSPQSAQSHWVNEEIIYFKQNRRGGQIFSIIVDGVPFATNDPERAHLECFPPALRFEVNEHGELTDIPAEPMAADISDSGDGKRLGLLRLISGMIGVGLDDLVQRDMQKERRRVTLITATALMTVLIMSGLTWTAMSARGAAEEAQAEAEQRRADAEGLTEFMLTDLKDRLEPLGKLDVMDGVAGKVIDYYDNYDGGVVDCEASSRHAQSLHLAAEIANSSGDQEAFADHADQAYQITERNLAECENQERALYDHGQSAFWQGYVALGAGDALKTEEHWNEYRQFLSNLHNKNRAHILYGVEYALAIANSGVSSFYSDDLDIALSEFNQAIIVFEELKLAPELHQKHYIDFADVVGWQALSLERLGEISSAISARKREIDIVNSVLEGSSKDNWEAIYVIASAYRRLAKLYIKSDDYNNAKSMIVISKNLMVKLSENDPDNVTWNSGLIYTQLLFLEMLAESQSTLKFLDADRELQLMIDELKLTSETIEHLSKERDFVLSKIATKE